MNRLLAPYVVVLAASFAFALPAQEDTPKQFSGSFFPKDYTHEFFLDLDALQDTEVWSVVERTVFAGMGFQKFRQEFGYRLRDLKTIRVGVTKVKREGERYARERSVTMFRGTRPFKLPKARDVKPSEWGSRRTKARLAGFDVLEETGTFYNRPKEERELKVESLFVIPKPDRLVYGDHELIASVLRGKRRGGVPHPDLMALTAGYRPLAYVASDIKSANGENLFEADWRTDEDPIRYLMLRLHVEPKSGNTILSLSVRFQTGEHGPALLQKGLEGFLAKWAKDKRLAAIHKLLTGVRFKQDRTDLVATVDAGGPREVGNLVTATTIMPLMLWFDSMAGADVKVQAVPAQAAPLKAAEAKPVQEVKQTRKTKEAKKK